VVVATAVGDALGEPFEQSPRDIERDAENPDLRTWNGSYQKGRYADAGVWTDDAGMTLALAETLVDKGVDRDAILAAYGRWFKNLQDPARGTGGTVRRAMENHLAGAGPDSCGVRTFPGGYVGNGTAMRAAPYGLYFARRSTPHALEEMVRACVEDARLTHHHPEAEAGSIAVAGATYGAVLTLDPAAYWGHGVAAQRLVRVLDEAGYRYTRVRGAVAAIQMLLRTEWEGFSGGRWPIEFLDGLARDFGRGGDVAATVATALLAASRSGSQGVRVAVMGAVRMSGDADTRAAITSAWMGASYGLKAFPDEWLETLYRLEDLIAVDQRLNAP
jgi:ADP-ribosylglycohydrolase